MLLALLKPFLPAALIGAVALGTPVGWFARQAVFETIEKPALVHSIEQKERDACTIRTQAAADAAEDIERKRQQIAGDEAFAAYRKMVEARDIAQADAQSQLESENAENEAKLAERGRSCIVDGDDVIFLQGR